MALLVVGEVLVAAPVRADELVAAPVGDGEAEELPFLPKENQPEKKDDEVELVAMGFKVDEGDDYYF